MSLTKEYIDKRIEERVQAYMNLIQPYWTIKELKEKLNIKSNTYVRDLLKFYQDELENDIVIYPGSKGTPYVIKSFEMCKWLDENMQRINEEKKMWRVS
ncbi:DUF771 domain-containing protein [Macrococcoides bohemicum]|uniref:DUF771 domain-containing protein n=1 Tax=Macrococcoides bohemicum TaxID=1903056 RepID=UPI0028A0345B|nr:DUF771 domain-containing protein [Macrococcus bohemicus]